MNINQISTQHSIGTQARSAKKSASAFGSQLVQAASEQRTDVCGDRGALLTYEPLDASAEEIDSIKGFCDNVFLPTWLERLQELDRLEEEEQTLNILFEYVDKLVEQMKEENRDKLRAEQLEFWLKRSI